MAQGMIERLISELDSDDTAARVTARDTLATLGPPAVAPLLDRLRQPPSDRAGSMYVVTLQRLGRFAFAPVVKALADEPEVAGELARVLRGLGPACLDEYLGVLDHVQPAICAAAAGALGTPAALPHADRLLPLLADPAPEVRRSARAALTALGEDAVPLLRHVRRHGPGAQRRGALAVLAELVDPRDLDPADRAAVRRLIRIKRLDETPHPLTACFLSWIAVRTGDQDALLDLLGLTDPEPVTFTLGSSVADADGHDGADGPPFPQYARVYVTPELDGWTLLLGRWCSPIDAERTEEVARICRELSARYGSAQAYFHGAQNDGSAWLVAEDGVILRRAASEEYYEEGEEEAEEIGDPLPAERLELARLAAEFDGEDLEFEWGFAQLDMARKLAAALSIDPYGVGPATRVRGRGVLALTPYGVEYGVPPGAMPI
ncbi:hypothetical protein [Kitasatospora sp. NPDC101183]|uniref:hypothetical protein n=1 Tax=Kitasatospora sp. NPDC101183 TaxID=3364100 RepID=UPI003801CFC8